MGDIDIMKTLPLAERKKHYILEVASRLFSRLDFHHVCMEDVAREARLAKGTLYNYFNSKEELYFAIIETRMQTLIRQLEERLQYRHPPVMDLRRFVVHLYSFFLKYPNFFVIWKREEVKTSSPQSKNCRKLRAQLRVMLTAILRRGIAEGAFRDFSSLNLLGDCIFGIIDGMAMRGIHANANEDRRKEERENMFSIILALVERGNAHD
ncbi:MAG: TetR/AcrR family transcriptional regulator [Chlorobi bacterium]|nr:TetR/AcrR family transcriptional regulator [Chlorobiota bacterium]